MKALAIVYMDGHPVNILNIFMITPLMSSFYTSWNVLTIRSWDLWFEKGICISSTDKGLPTKVTPKIADILHPAWNISCHVKMVGEGNGTPLQYSCLENKWTEEPGRLQSMGSPRVGHHWETSLFTFLHWRRKWQPTPVFLPGESQGWGSLVGCHLWGRTESDTTEVT